MHLFSPLKEEAKTLRFKLIFSVFLAVIILAGFFCYFYPEFFWHNPNIEIKFAETLTKTASGEIIPENLKDFGLKIDKLNISVPVIANVDGSKESAYNKALKEGVAHYKGTSLPGEGSNIFIFGHSSAWYATSYDKVFAELDKLENGDVITIYYNSKKYQYSVFENKIIKADDVSVLNKTTTETLTLMTCWPVGTNLKRLVVIAKPAL